jgi:hypothetical protein
VQAARSGGFSWKWLFLILIAVFVGLIYLDVTENGRGIFASELKD